MGRTEDRKMKRKVNQKLGKGTIDKIANDLNQEVVNREVEARCGKFRNLFIDSVVEAMQMNGLSNSKIKSINDDIELVFGKKVHGVE